jgi:hypothetical protein
VANWVLPINRATQNRMKLYASMTNPTPERIQSYGSPQEFKNAQPDLQQSAIESVRRPTDQQMTAPPIRVRGGPPAMHRGGIIPRTGIYRMQKGERVIPSRMAMHFRMASHG